MVCDQLSAGSIPRILSRSPAALSKSSESSCALELVAENLHLLFYVRCGWIRRQVDLTHVLGASVHTPEEASQVGFRRLCSSADSPAGPPRGSFRR